MMHGNPGLITMQDHFGFGALWRKWEGEILTVADVVGPAYGASMTDRSLKVERKLFVLRTGLMNTCFDRLGHADGDAQPYDHVTRADRTIDPRKSIRRMATTIIEPEIPFEEPPPWHGRRGSRLTGPLTFREHLVIGGLLSRMHRDLQDLAVNRLQKAYGRDHTTIKRVHTVVKKLEALRAALDSRVSMEHLSSDEVEGVRVTHALLWSTSQHGHGRQRLIP